MRRRINKKKLRDEWLMLMIAILGIVIFICNMTKTIPGGENGLTEMVSYIIAYGFLVGPALTVMGLISFWEIRNTRYPRKRTR